MNVLILTDYRGQFWLKTSHKEANFDLELLRRSFADLGCYVETKTFSDIQFGDQPYSQTFVLYQSTQDPGLLYRSYIEDVLLGLKLAGATLIPDFHFCRAHHNKVFMEILRRVVSLNDIKNIRSHWFGTYEEYLRRSNIFQDRPIVFKLGDGDQSKHVKLLRSTRDKFRVPKRLSRTFHPYHWLTNKVKPFLKTTYPNYRLKSDHRRKFIIQDFIAGLDGDYKVLVFCDKYYVLHRRTRPDDFRASGSGLFTFERDLPPGLLDFAERAFRCFQVPFISLDIACKGSDFFLLEFQFVHFGGYALEKSSFYFVRQHGNWEIIDDVSVLEQELARSVVAHAQAVFCGHA